MSTSWPIISTICSTYSVACGMSVGRSKLIASIALHHTASHLVAISCHGRSSRRRG